jgi:hypothetical protein
MWSGNIRMVVCMLGLAIMMPNSFGAAAERQKRLMQKDVIVQDVRAGDVRGLMREGVNPPLAIVPLADALAIRQELLSFLRKSPIASERKVLADFDDYYIQYIGYARNGRNIVFLNGVCSSQFESLRLDERHVELVADGGPCFFSVHYDIASKRILELFVHGSA